MKSYGFDGYTHTIYNVLAKAEKSSHSAGQAGAGRGASLLYVPCQLTGRGDCLKRSPLARIR